MRSADIRNDNRRGGGLLSSDIRNSALLGRDVRNGSITGSDVQDNSLFTSDIASNAIGADELSANSVRGSELAANSVQGDEVQNGSLRKDDLAAGQVFSGTVVRSDSTNVAADGGFAEPDVACAPGERALGGGISLLKSELARPSRLQQTGVGRRHAWPAAQRANGWVGGIVNGENTADTAVVWAICAS